MASEWKEKPLGELFRVKHGFAFKGEHFVDEPTKHLITTPGNFAIGGGFQNTKPKYYNGPVPEDYILKAGDVIVTMTDLSKASDTLGNAALVPKDENVWLHNQRVGLLEFNEEEDVDPNFVCYLLRSNEYRSWIVGSATGTTVKHTSPSRIAEFSCLIPPLPEQKAIARILGSLDDKIELNRRMNETLEGMAQALFKSWFTDFDPVIDNILMKNMAEFLEQNQPSSPLLPEGEEPLDAEQSLALWERLGEGAFKGIPDELADRAETRRQALAVGTANREAAKSFPASFIETDEMGWIPEGWEVNELENATSTIIDHRGKTPKKLSSDWAESGYPAVSAKNVKDGKLVRKDTIRFTDQELYEKWMSEELQKGDVLMTSEAPLGEKLYLAKQFKWVLSQRLFALRANEEISGVYLYHWLNTDIAKADIDGRASGTTVQGIRQSELRKVKVLTPCSDCIAAFSEASDALMEKRATNEENTEALTKLRDTLLPKLISGELRLTAASLANEIFSITNSKPLPDARPATAPA